VVQVPNAGRVPDLLVDDPRDRVSGDRDKAAPVARPPGLPDYEESGAPVGEDDEADT
jgi:hypothetical protein